MEKPSSIGSSREEYNTVVARWHASTTRDVIIESLYAASTFIFPIIVLDSPESAHALIATYIIRILPLVTLNQTELAQTVKRLLSGDGDKDYNRMKIKTLLSIPAFFRPALIPISVCISDITISSFFEHLPNYDLIKRCFPLDVLLTLIVTIIIFAQQQSARNIAREILRLSVPETSGVRVATDTEVKDGTRLLTQTQKDPFARKTKRRK